MACNTNCKKIFIGGIAAGVFLNVVEMVTHAVVLMPRYQALEKMGHVYNEPHVPFAVYHVIMLLVGISLASLYAGVRDTWGPGPKTAMKLGLIVAFVAAVPGNYAAAAWSVTGKYIPFVTTIAIFIEGIFGTLIAAALYKPKA